MQQHPVPIAMQHHQGFFPWFGFCGFFLRESGLGFVLKARTISGERASLAPWTGLNTNHRAEVHHRLVVVFGLLGRC